MATAAVVPTTPQRFEVADILRDHAQHLRLSNSQARAVQDIVACRTEQLGGHLEVCPDCGFSRGTYNSCLMVSPRFWGAPSLARQPCRAIRRARRPRHSP